MLQHAPESPFTLGPEMIGYVAKSESRSLPVFTSRTYLSLVIQHVTSSPLGQWIVPLG